MNNKRQKIRQISAIDLFAGAGGFSLSAINCNVNVVAAIEFDKDAIETYKYNIVEKRSPNTKLYPLDILRIEPKKFREELNLKEGDLDILIGGPPCQGFSTHRINDSGVNDPRNDLLLRYFDFVEELQPKLFLVENVPGLLWKRHEKYLADFKSQAKKHGYLLLNPVKLNAKNYGVPQNRERVFLLGIKNNIDIKELQWPPKATHFSPKEKNTLSWKTASTVFNKPPSEVLLKLNGEIKKKGIDNLEFGEKLKTKKLDASAIHMNHTPRLIERFEATPINGSREDIDFRLPCHYEGYKGHKDVYGRIRLAQPAPTITTGCFNPSKGRFLHPWLHHGITIRHAARLQSFPDDYIFSNGITSQGKQVGNAVPILLGQHLIAVLRDFLQNQKCGSE